MIDHYTTGLRIAGLLNGSSFLINKSTQENMRDLFSRTLLCDHKFHIDSLLENKVSGSFYEEDLITN